MWTASKALAIAAAFLVTPISAQTYSNCNPISSSSCPADSALGRTVNIDFTSGSSDSFTAQGNPTYDKNGASFTVAKSGDSPQLTSKWYIMFGRVDVVMKAAPGAGIVSSFVMQSDDLDEIDWEWLGADSEQVQTNYFGKGQTTTYNRGAFHPNSGNQSGFKKYTIIWTSSQIIWQIDGTTVRTLEPANADNQYPQTPMQIKVGAWSGGDSSNPQGTIQWARGPTDYTKGPFTMQVQSLYVQDYSTGTSYAYGDQSGSWQSIKSNGGKINSGGSAVQSSSPAVTSSSSGQPIPFSPRESTSTFVTPSVYPWVPEASSMATAASATYSNYPGLPSGWSVSSSGKVVPPSSAPSTLLPASSTLYSSALPSASSGDSEVVTAYDQQGFKTVYTVPAGQATAPKSYDSRGFLITAAPAPTSTTISDTALQNNAVSSTTAKPSSTNAADQTIVSWILVITSALLGVFSFM